MAIGFKIQDINKFINDHKNGSTIKSLYNKANVSREVLISNFRRFGYDCTGKHPVKLCKGNCGEFVLTIGYEYCHDCKERIFHSGKNNVSHRPEVRKKISEKFRSDESETKSSGSVVFDKFILILHGLSKELVDKLKEEQGIFQLHITNSNVQTTPKDHDFILFEDKDTFEEDVERVIRILTK